MPKGKKSGKPGKSKPKKLSYELIAPEATATRDMYALMNRLISDIEDHSHLTNARIALAWHKDVKPNVDGWIMLGKAKKASDLDRELAPWDFVIVLNQEFWQKAKPEQRKALLDHELCHCEVERGSDDEPKRDEKDRVCYRIRKHDIEEFKGVVERNGIWKRDLESFAKALRGKTAQADLFDPSAVAPEPRDEQSVAAAGSVVEFTGPKAVK